MGVTVVDGANTNLGYLVSVDGGATTTSDQVVLDTSGAGVHSILYSATGATGAVGTALRTVVVIDPAAAATSTPSTTGGDTATTTATSTQQ